MEIGELTDPSLHGIELAHAAIRLWRGVSGSLQLVGSSANQVYRFAESGRTRYLRLTWGAHRTADQIEAELDFIAYLQRNGVDAMPPVASAAGRLVEEIPLASGSAFACVFEEAAGERFRYESARPDQGHFKLRGRTLGRIHALSKAYVPSGSPRRFGWNEDSLLQNLDRLLPETETEVWRAYEELRERFQSYSKSSESYGLIHGDFGETNYRCRGDRLDVFDFDDCCYHWFAYDLAVAIYPHGGRKEGLQLLDRLLEGYSENTHLDVTLAQITTFCRWRLVYMFLVYARRWGVENLSAQQSRWFALKRDNIARGYQWQCGREC